MGEQSAGMMMMVVLCRSRYGYYIGSFRVGGCEGDLVLVQSGWQWDKCVALFY